MADAYLTNQNLITGMIASGSSVEVKELKFTIPSPKQDGTTVGPSINLTSKINAVFLMRVTWSLSAFEEANLNNFVPYDWITVMRSNNATSWKYHFDICKQNNQIKSRLILDGVQKPSASIWVYAACFYALE